MKQVVDWWAADKADRELVREGKLPVVLRGLVRHWPLVEKGLQGMHYLAPYLLQFDNGNIFEAMIAPVSVKDRKSTRLNSSHVKNSYAVCCLKKKSRPIL